jgi:hypothetical protein
MTEFYDTFGHGKMDAPPKKEGKVFSLSGETVTPADDVDFRKEIVDLLDEVQSEGEVTRAIVILDGPNLGLRVRYVGDMDLSQVIGTLQVAGFVIMHECQTDD